MVSFRFSMLSFQFFLFSLIVELGSRSKVYLKSLIRDLDLELVAIIAMSPPTTMKFLDVSASLGLGVSQPVIVKKNH